MMGNDLISRAALLKSFKNKCMEDCGYCPFAIYNPEKPEIVCSLIRIAPAVDAEPVRHGRWEENGRCTNCGGHAPYWAMATTYYKSPYCFECGAKMTEVSKEG